MPRHLAGRAGSVAFRAYKGVGRDSSEAVAEKLAARQRVTELADTEGAYPNFWVLTNFGNDVTVEIKLQAMMRKPHTDCFPTPATFAWQGAGKSTVM